MGIFQPGPSETTQNSSTTISPAQQALAQFKIQLLGQILNSMGGNKTSFKDFVGGAPATRSFPTNAGAGMAEVLAAMKQPGAFTSTTSGSGTTQGATPSTFSDLTQLGLLAALASQSGALGGLGSLIGHPLDTLGGWLQIGQNPGPGVTPEAGGNTLSGLTGSGGLSLNDILGGNFGAGPQSYNTDGTSLSLADLLG